MASGAVAARLNHCPDLLVRSTHQLVEPDLGKNSHFDCHDIELDLNLVEGSDYLHMVQDFLEQKLSEKTD